jgi:hypothetical protein
MVAGFNLAISKGDKVKEPFVGLSLFRFLLLRETTNTPFPSALMSLCKSSVP